MNSISISDTSQYCEVSSIKYNNEVYDLKIVKDDNGIDHVYSLANNLAIYSNASKSRYILRDARKDILLSLDLDSCTIKPITKSSIFNFSYRDYEALADNENTFLLWCLCPSISDDGKHIIYWSNKNIKNRQPVLQDSIWLYSYEVDKDELLLTIKDEDFMISSSYLYFINNHQFLYILYDKNKYVYINIYDIHTKENSLIRRLKPKIKYTYQSGFIFVANNSQELYIHNLITEYKKVIILKDVSEIKPSYLQLSPDQSMVAYPDPYTHTLFVIDILSGSISSYYIKDFKNLFLVKSWITNNDIELNILGDNIIESHYILNL